MQEKSRSKICNKDHAREMMHYDTKRLLLLNGERPREHLFIAVDDFSRELYADILPQSRQQRF